jgi:hypothetical protein
MPKWEYRVLKIPDSHLDIHASPAQDAELNRWLAELGEGEWEIVGMQPVQSASYGTVTIFCICKRLRRASGRTASGSWPGRASSSSPDDLEELDTRS